MRTTGTSNNRMKSFFYPRREYEIIQRYHFDRLMHFNDIPFGNIVRFMPRYSFGSPKFQTLGIHKGPLDVAMSYSNITYYAVYPPANIPDVRFWKSLFKAICDLKPKLIYCTPGEFELFCNITIKPPDCPIVFSGETLYPHIRNKAEELFPRAIDKMRCWDGGLSFFECKYGRKHINDELSIVERVDDTLVSTDLFNFNHKFIRYFNGDCGVYESGTCSCGIYGNYFTHFNGKEIECLISSYGEKVIPGSVIINSILKTCKNRPEFKDVHFKFNVVQDKEKNIVIYGNTDLNEEQVFLIRFNISSIVCNGERHNIKVEYKKKEINDVGAKQLLVKSHARNT